MDGFIKIPRSEFMSDLWQEKRVFSKWEAWLDLMAQAAFTSRSVIVAGRSVSIAPGELVASVRYLQARWKWSTDRVTRFLRMLVDSGRVRIRIEAGTQVITITDAAYCEIHKDGNEDAEPMQEDTPALSGLESALFGRHKDKGKDAGSAQSEWALERVDGVETARLLSHENTATCEVSKDSRKDTNKDGGKDTNKDKEKKGIRKKGKSSAREKIPADPEWCKSFIPDWGKEAVVGAWTKMRNWCRSKGLDPDTEGTRELFLQFLKDFRPAGSELPAEFAEPDRPKFPAGFIEWARESGHACSWASWALVPNGIKRDFDETKKVEC